MSKQSSTESGPSSSNRLSRQSSSETTGGGPPGGGGGGGTGPGGPRIAGNRDPYQSWHGTPRVEHRGGRGNGAELNSHTTSLPRRSMGVDGKRRSAGDPSAIPLIEYSLVENGHHDEAARHYATLERSGQRGGARPKVNVSDNRRSHPAATYDNANHIGGGRLGNHVDSEAAEAEDYYPDGNLEQQPPRPQMPRGPRGAAGGYVKYNSFANY